jgi:hypothetical protein
MSDLAFKRYFDADSFDRKVFKSLSGNITKQLEMIPEKMWIDKVVPNEQKFKSHEYPLHVKRSPNSGWDCDKIPGVGKCFSGLTAFYQSDGMDAWFCNQKNFCVCEKCMKVDMLLQELEKEDDAPADAFSPAAGPAPVNRAFITPAGHIK